MTDMNDMGSEQGFAAGRIAPPLRLLGCFSLALAAGMAPTAHAHDFCVASAVELQQALTDASDGGTFAGEDNLVRLVQGRYQTGSATANLPFHYSSTGGSLSLEGGYTGACAARSPKAALTVLDGNHITAVLAIFNANATVSVSALTFENGESTQEGAGLSINTGAASGSSQVFLQGNIIRRNHTSVACGGFIAYAYGHELLAQNNLIANNVADQNYGAGCAIGNGDLNLVYNNTVAFNASSASGSTGGLYVSGANGGGIFVINDILRNNSAFGLHIESPGITFAYNAYGQLDGEAPGVSVGNVQADAQFADAANSDFHLSTASPLLGYSPFISGEMPNGLDPDGNPRPARGHSDVGAYNETIFADRFEP